MSEALLFLGGGAVALLASAASTRWLASHPGALLGRLDQPNERSLHETPVPRTGGLGLLAGVLGAWLVLGALAGIPPELGWILAALVLVAGVSFLDDLGHLSPALRLAAHFGAAATLVLGGLSSELIEVPGLVLSAPWPIWGTLSLLFVVWMINLFNFMDGMDGFAGGMATIGFAALAILGWLGDEHAYAAAAGSVAAAAAGFLTANFPPARIFLGDVGSSALGLLAAAFSLWGVQLGLFPLWAAVLVFSPFILDATWTLLVRIARRERIWEAHRSHHYQRLVLAGWSHRKTLLRGYVVMVAVAACAVASRHLSDRDQWMLLGAWAIIYWLIHFKVALVERLAAADRPCTQ